ncbi:MAG: hypothetical protein ACYC5G_01650, partial [Candidatus Doudnabacteria bacterium]
ELYYNDKNGYPYSLYSLTPNYLLIVPIAPTPADGSCTFEQNWYTYKESGYSYMNYADRSFVYPSYRLDFCLSGTTGGISAGPHFVSPEGIK